MFWSNRLKTKVQFPTLSILENVFNFFIWTINKKSYEEEINWDMGEQAPLMKTIRFRWKPPKNLVSGLWVKIVTLNFKLQQVENADISVDGVKN